MISSPRDRVGTASRPDAERIVRAQSVVGRSLGASSVLVNLTTNEIFELNETGGRIWDLLATPRSARELAEQLNQEFEIEATAAEAAVVTLLGQLEAQGLVRYVP